MSRAGPSNSTGNRWDVARRQARQLESSLDAKLTAYSRLANEIANSSGNNAESAYGAYAAGGKSRDHTALPMDGSGKVDPSAQEQDVEDLLAQLSDSVETLTLLLDDPSTAASTVQKHAVQRHREVLLDFQKDYRRLKTNVQQAVDRRDLLGNIRQDIDSYKAKYASDTDALLAERSRLDNSHSMIDSTLEQAYSTRSDLASQRDLLESVASRIAHTAQTLPGINGVITMIGRRRRRDSIIMGLVIGSCTVLILMYLTSGH